MKSSQLLEGLGDRIREGRKARGWSQRELCRRSGVSPRFLVQVEAGDGNPSLLRLAELSRALDISLVELLAGLGPVDGPIERAASRLRQLPPGQRRAAALRLGVEKQKVALVGLRGAGKSTVGRALAERLGCGFVVLDREIEQLSGMRLAEVFEFHGSARYRSLAREALGQVLGKPGSLVIELGGSLVEDEQLYTQLRAATRVVWLRASPEEHLRRVREQGDLRPMIGRSDALGELRGILTRREPLYGLADRVVETEESGVGEIVEGLVG